VSNENDLYFGNGLTDLTLFPE